MKTVFLFSGQGAQYHHMGHTLMNENPAFRNEMTSMDAFVLDRFGFSVLDQLYATNQKIGAPLRTLHLAGAAILMVEMAMVAVLRSVGIKPDIVVGSSLGTFAAAVAAERTSPKMALEKAIQHSLHVESLCEPGCMVAIVAPPSSLEAWGLDRFGELAAINSPASFVLACHQARWQPLEMLLRTKDAIFQKLPVDFAFHASGIEPAEDACKNTFQGFSLKPGHIPMWCCTRSSALTSEVNGDYFWEVIRRPIRSDKALAALEQQGPYRYIDLGPSGTMVNLVRQVQPVHSRSLAHALMSPFGGETKSIERLLAQIANTSAMQTSA
jgi:acyl transferase domain-containing protein